MADAIRSILWRRIDQPGHEAARIVPDGSGWRVLGCAVCAFEGQPCRLEYSILCDSQWKTRSAEGTGFVGTTEVKKHVQVNGANWLLNGKASPAVAGCIDVDLNFSPVTNTLPIRRLNLAVGQE